MSPPADGRRLLAQAVAAYEQGRLAEAGTLYTRALAEDPGNHRALHDLGLIAGAAGRPDQACELLGRAVEAAPAAAVYRYDHGCVLHRLGRLDEAISAYRGALERGLRDAAVLGNLGHALLGRGAFDEALQCLVDALVIDERSPVARAGLAEVFSRHVWEQPVEGLAEVLGHCYGFDDINHDRLGRNAAVQLGFRYAGAAPVTTLEDLPEAMWSDPLLLGYLRRGVNRSSALERWMIGVRDALGEALIERGTLDEHRRPLAVSLALQCLNNEHVLAETPGDRARVDAIRARIVLALDSATGAAAPRALTDAALIWGLYRPLGALEATGLFSRFAVDGWPDELAALLRRAVTEPAEERAIADGLQGFGIADDAVSRAVRAQYEGNPYPRWFGMPTARQARRAADVFAGRYPGFVPADTLRGPVRVLVAGCGTGQQPIGLALDLLDAAITAFDLSRASLAYAVRMARSLGVTGIRFLHGDLLAVAALGERFEIIECSGVLHHLRDPMAGWRALTERLEPGGIMKIALYSERARAHLAPLRDEIEARGLDASEAGIRAYRAELLEREPRPAILDGGDFYTLSTCRDLLFHVQEHRFTIPRIADCIEALGLGFVGFSLPARVLAAYDAMFPRDPGRRSLGNWDAFEAANPEAFGAMYQFHVEKAMD